MYPASVATGAETVQHWLSALLRPIRALRRRYVPLLMVYFAYGSIGIIAVTQDMWIKESLTLSPAELAGVSVWLTLPWTMKMVFGQLVDSVPIFGSQRRSYILIGAAFITCGMLTLAGTTPRRWKLILAIVRHSADLGAYSARSTHLAGHLSAGIAPPSWCRRPSGDSRWQSPASPCAARLPHCAPRPTNGISRSVTALRRVRWRDWPAGVAASDQVSRRVRAVPN